MSVGVPLLFGKSASVSSVSPASSSAVAMAYRQSVSLEAAFNSVERSSSGPLLCARGVAGWRPGPTEDRARVWADIDEDTSFLLCEQQSILLLHFEAGSGSDRRLQLLLLLGFSFVLLSSLFSLFILSSLFTILFFASSV